MRLAARACDRRDRNERGEILIMTLLVIVVVSVTCAALLGLQWTGSKAQTIVAAARADRIAADSDLDSVIGVIRADPTTYGAIDPTTNVASGTRCMSTTTPDAIYQDDAVEVLCTPQPGAAPNHRDFLLKAKQYANGAPGSLLAQTSIDVADVDTQTGSPHIGAVVRVRSWIEEPGQ